MHDQSKEWELHVVAAEMGFDGETEGAHGNCVADLDGDGHVEFFTCGKGQLTWHRPATGERGLVVDHGFFGVGVVAVDLYGDGRAGLLTNSNNAAGNQIVYFTPRGTCEDGFDAEVIDGEFVGLNHDILAADLDGDGQLEIVANGCYCENPGTFVYKFDGTSWRRYDVQRGKVEEGLAVGEFSRGKVGIASGVRVYERTGDGLDAWRATDVAPRHREMCRVAAFDVCGNGLSDVVIIDSEYYDGTLSWCENLGGGKWREHQIDHGLYYGHTLHVASDAGAIVVTLAEMQVGGWNPDRNYDARTFLYRSTDRGQTWQRETLHVGQGTHEAEWADVDGDGELELIGKEFYKPRVTYLKKPAEPSPILDYEHRFLDRDKPEVGIEIVCADIDGDGREDVACASWWYHMPTATRYKIPGIAHVINAVDLDGDGKLELICLLRNEDKTGYDGLTSKLAIAKAVDPFAEKWDIIPIGEGIGDWPHGNVVGKFMKDGGFALATCYHSAHSWGEAGLKHFPELFVAPKNPLDGHWEKRTLAEINYGEELLAADMTGDGNLDIVAGCWSLANDGEGNFTPHEIVPRDEYYPARCSLANIAGGPQPDLVCAEEVMDYETKTVPWSPLCWFERPRGGPDPAQPWRKHVIDYVRCGHSIGTADLDGDGETEIVVGEHYPFAPFRSRCRLYVYKQLRRPGGESVWKRFTLDDRFEHHDGCKILDLGDGRKGIVSHAWQEAGYVHLWAPRS